MFKDFIDKVTAQYSKNLPFVVYRKPKEQLVIALFQEDNSLHHLTDFSESGFIFAPFDRQKEIVLLHSDERLEVAATSLKASQNVNIAIEVAAAQKEFHLNLVKKGIKRIRKSEFEKVVLSRKVEVDCTVSPTELFKRLLANYQNAFCYLWHHPKIGTWLGATPEILLKAENQQITTMSLAGTQEYNGDENPTWGTKELEEQDLVTNYISSALKGKVSNLDISERETIRAGNLLHLRTKLTADYEKGRLGEILIALHPTPAICGMPMIPSKEFILKNENYHRGFYTGYLGELNMKSENKRSSRKRNVENRVYKSIKSTTTFFVNLRCMQLKDDKAIIYVGGGVTKDSNADKEWEETLAKTNTMLRVLTLD